MILESIVISYRTTTQHVISYLYTIDCVEVRTTSLYLDVWRWHELSNAKCRGNERSRAPDVIDEKNNTSSRLPIIGRGYILFLIQRKLIMSGACVRGLHLLWNTLQILLINSFYRYSFVISPRGEITHVYHPVGEDDEVIVSKKGFAALFASRLHEEGEVQCF